jgi:hypothetical protein
LHKSHPRDATDHLPGSSHNYLPNANTWTILNRIQLESNYVHVNKANCIILGIKTMPNNKTIAFQAPSASFLSTTVCVCMWYFKDMTDDAVKPHPRVLQSNINLPHPGARGKPHPRARSSAFCHSLDVLLLSLGNHPRKHSCDRPCDHVCILHCFAARH